MYGSGTPDASGKPKKYRYKGNNIYKAMWFPGDWSTDDEYSEDSTYYVEKILDNGWMWDADKQEWVQVLHVEWKGYAKEDNTWEPRTELEQTAAFGKYIKDTDICYWTPKPDKNPTQLNEKKYQNIGSFTVSLEWNMTAHLNLFSKKWKTNIIYDKDSRPRASLQLTKTAKQQLKKELQI